MSDTALRRPLDWQPIVTEFVHEKLLMGQPAREYARGLVTPFNLAAGVIVAIGLPLVAWRFWAGLAAVTNLSQTTPWGLWIGFDMLCGVALAAGGFTLSSAVYILGLEKYHPVVRPAVLTGFLGYLFAVLGLMCDLGQPWRLPYPLVYQHGTTSVMFEVGWCVAVYLTVLFLEFTPAAFEWLGLRGLRKRAVEVTLGLTVLGVVLSTLHQSSLGALFLTAPDKLHPLWYSGFLPVFFYISAVIAGLSMVIVESALSHRAFRSRIDPQQHVDLDELTIGLGRAAAVVLFAYFFLKLQGLVDGGRFDLLLTPLGAWFLVELLGLVLLPSLLFAFAARRNSAAGVRAAAALAVLGIVVNRLNVSVIGFNWNVADRYVPSFAELWISLTLVTLGILTFRWIVNRMPILNEHPEYRGSH
jgi:Ni/Fe-hydrogenase subunit HybB-like protein